MVRTDYETGFCSPGAVMRAGHHRLPMNTRLAPLLPLLLAACACLALAGAPPAAAQAPAKPAEQGSGGRGISVNRPHSNLAESSAGAAGIAVNLPGCVRAVRERNCLVIGMPPPRTRSGCSGGVRADEGISLRVRLVRRGHFRAGLRGCWSL